MTQFMTPGQAPREIDCDCGERHIVDPDAADKVIRRRRFTCSVCSRRQRTDLIAAFAMNDHGSADPVCIRCAINHLHALLVDGDRP